MWINNEQLYSFDNAIIRSVYVSGGIVYAVGEHNEYATLWMDGVDTALDGGTLATSVFVSGSDVYVTGGQNLDEALLWVNGTITVLATGSDSFSESVFVVPPPLENHTITVSNDGNGSASANPTEAVAGTTITLTAVANEGYKFEEWQVLSGGIVIANPTANPTTFTMSDNDVEIKATFTKETGIVSAENLALIRISPNPTNGKLVIESGSLCIQKIEIFDMYGRAQIPFNSLKGCLPQADGVVNITSIPKGSQESIVVNISHLPSGIYAIKITTEAGEWVQKVVKE
jgi:hypothetical protein